MTARAWHRAIVHAGSPHNRATDAAFLLRRQELVLALVRSAGALSTMIVILGQGLTSEYHGPLVANAAVIVLSATAATYIRRHAADGALGRLIIALTVAEIAYYAAYSAAYHDLSGASSFVGALLLIEGPVRFGAIGSAVTAIPVAVIAIVWSQVDAAATARAPSSSSCCACSSAAQPRSGRP